MGLSRSAKRLEVITALAEGYLPVRWRIDRMTSNGLYINYVNNFWAIFESLPLSTTVKSNLIFDHLNSKISDGSP